MTTVTLQSAVMMAYLFKKLIAEKLTTPKSTVKQLTLTKSREGSCQRLTRAPRTNEGLRVTSVTKMMTMPIKIRM